MMSHNRKLRTKPFWRPSDQDKASLKLLQVEHSDAEPALLYSSESTHVISQRGLELYAEWIAF